MILLETHPRVHSAMQNYLISGKIREIFRKFADL